LLAVKKIFPYKNANYDNDGSELEAEMLNNLEVGFSEICNFL
jgi:hypothetical protein